MSKNIKYGNIELNSDDFKNENALIRISMMIPMNLYKDLKKMSLTEEYSGKYQLLLRDILNEYIQKHNPAKKKKKVG